MKAIMISIKPKWCADIMNGEKTIEVRKENVGKAVQKLIDEQGFADIYVYCTKEEELFYSRDTQKWFAAKNRNIKEVYRLSNGVVKFKFRCYKVDDYVNGRKWSWKVGAPMWGACNDYEYILKDACLTDDELRNYADDLAFSAIHISDLEIFDKPKELSEFKRCTEKTCIYGKCHKYMHCLKPLTKSPQSFCYIEVEDK